MRVGLSLLGLMVVTPQIARGQVAVDGYWSDSERALGSLPIFVQTNPTGFGDNRLVTGCDPFETSSPEAVATGFEVAIPLALLGNPGANTVKVVAFINGRNHDVVSNQVLPGVGGATSLDLGDPRQVDFGQYPGNQFVVIPASVGTSPSIDGQLDAGYGSPLAVQTTRTSFGDSQLFDVALANGSELDAVYGFVSGSMLHLFFAGNIGSGYAGRLDIFFDTGAPGWNQLGTDAFPDVDFGSIQRMQAAGALPGLRFDAGFNASHFMSVGVGDYEFHANLTSLGELAPGYLGLGFPGDVGGTLYNSNPAGVMAAVNNSNGAGVWSACPVPAGGPDAAFGSEIDGVFAYPDFASRELHVIVTGNLESNSNNLDLFFDVDGSMEGQNTLRGDNVNAHFDLFNNLAGLTFDPDFLADYWVSLRNHDGGRQVYANAAVLRANGPVIDFNYSTLLDYSGESGGMKYPGNYPIRFDGPRADVPGWQFDIYTNYSPRLCGLPFLSGNLNPNPVSGQLAVALDNSNLVGVTDVSIEGADAVRTGAEFVISFDELGWDGSSCLKIAGFINSKARDFVSNQVIGGLPFGTSNLGPPALINFGAIEGNQFAIFCPVRCPWQVDQCPADFDNSFPGFNRIDGDDVISFFGDWDLGLPCADVNSDGAVDGDDVIRFFESWDVSAC